ncbi:MAG: hypothetical protein KDI30_11925, partial [Pseudomonadales bacterium]|nr:hypothetical protein [Pseudomonadales bacterium]
DGRDDLLFRNTVTGKYTVFLINNNVVDSQGPFNAYSSADFNFVSEVDADADGDADILLRSTSSGNWVLFTVDNGAVIGQNGLSVYTGADWQLQR